MRSPVTSLLTAELDAAKPPALTAGRSCVFFDVDGTLVDFAATPEQVHVDTGLIELLRATFQKLDGALALISGRMIADLDRLFDPLLLPAAGVHGLERRNAQGVIQRIEMPSEALAQARIELREFADSRKGLILEDKHYSLALHFRGAPRDEEIVRGVVAGVMNSLPPGFERLEGNKVVEIKPSCCSKASAVEAFLKEVPFTGRTPIFLGDDLTDLDGFAVVERQGGAAIAVGNRVSAQWKLPDPAAVCEWLSSFVAAPGNAR